MRPVTFKFTGCDLSSVKNKASFMLPRRTCLLAVVNDGRRTVRVIFRQIVCDDSHVLHYILPAKRDSLFTDRLRSAKTFPLALLHMRTMRYINSFLPFVLINFQ